jgi:two-component system chemotaxis response regulator CheY
MSYRVLIVDDALIMRLRIQEIAERAGWEVVGHAADGQEACDKYTRLRPHLVTLDIVMPKMDGVEALRLIRASDPQARICMVSAVSQATKLSECIRLGAIDFVVKPFDADRLLDLFEKQKRNVSAGDATGGD